MERLLRLCLFFAGLHVGHMAGEPVVKLDPEFGFERLRIHAVSHAAEDVKPVRVGLLELQRGEIGELGRVLLEIFERFQIF